MARKISVEIVGDSRSLERAFGRSSRSARKFQGDMNRTFRGALAGSGVFRGLGQSIAFASSMFLGAAGFTTVMAKSISAASDLRESMNKMGETFRGSARDIEQWSERSATAFGQSQAQALENAASIGAMLIPMGYARDEAAAMSKRMVELAADMASFNNQDPSEMLEKLRAGLAGQSRPLRIFGVNLLDTVVKQHAVEIGLIRTGQRMTEQQKIQARYSLILKQTADQTGDFARTSGDLANAQRILRAQLSDTLASLGQAMLPVITNIVTAMSDWLAVTKNQERLQRDFQTVIDTSTSALYGLAAALKAVRDAGKWLGDREALIGGGKFKLIDVARWKHDFREMERFGLKTQERVLGAFTRAGRGIGDWATAGRERARASLRRMEQDAEDTAHRIQTTFSGLTWRQLEEGRPARPVDPGAGLFAGAAGRRGPDAAMRNRWFDQMISRRLNRSQDLELRREITELRRIASLIQQRMAVTKDITRLLNLEDRLLDVRRAIRGARGRLADLAEARAEGLLDSLRFGVERAQVTQRLGDDLAALRAIRGHLIARIAGERGNLTLQRELLGVEAQIRAVLEERAHRAREAAELERQARQARQFRTLGFGPAGEDLIPGMQALRKQLGSIGQAVQGTFLDTSETKGVLGRIRRVLAGGLGALSDEVRRKVKEMLDDIDRQLKDRKGPRTPYGALNPDRILAGLGLSPAQLKAAKQRLGIVGPRGTVPTGGAAAFGVVLQPAPVTITLDGEAVGRAQIRYAQRQARGRATQTRGPQAGNAMGFVQ
jgi:hypothetical protein